MTCLKTNGAQQHSSVCLSWQLLSFAAALFLQSPRCWSFVPFVPSLRNGRSQLSSTTKLWSISTVDDGCEILGEGSLTSTFAEGTAEEDIVLTWEADAAETIRDRLLEHETDEPFMIGLIGNPGSGKTTSCTALSDLLHDYGYSTVVCPFDGYHIPLAELEKRPESQDLIYRRGAPDTFDASSLKRDLDRIRNGDEPKISLPGFDHALGDPSLINTSFIVMNTRLSWSKACICCTTTPSGPTLRTCWITPFLSMPMSTCALSG